MTPLPGIVTALCIKGFASNGTELALDRVCSTRPVIGCCRQCQSRGQNEVKQLPDFMQPEDLLLRYKSRHWTLLTPDESGPDRHIYFFMIPSQLRPSIVSGYPNNFLCSCYVTPISSFISYKSCISSYVIYISLLFFCFWNKYSHQ